MKFPHHRKIPKFCAIVALLGFIVVFVTTNVDEGMVSKRH